MNSDSTLCYVITPFGEKEVAGFGKVDFEEIYKRIICPAINEVRGHKIDVKRSKDVNVPGIINEEFIQNILNAEIAIVDLSANSSNVYYELGLRHAFRRKITIIIALENTALPFDIQNQRVIFYDYTTINGQELAKSMITKYIEMAFKEGVVDSPVFKAIPGYRIKLPSQKCKVQYTYEYKVQGNENIRIGVKTGDIVDIYGVDVWVNPENTDMEMGRIFEPTISSIIRHRGAVCDEVTGKVKKDLIQLYLRKKIGRRKQVGPTMVIITEPGRLRELGVRKLFHVAALFGEPGGYRPVDRIDKCVQNVLLKLNELNSAKTQFSFFSALFGKSYMPYTSILIPIFGVSIEDPEQDKVFKKLIDAACAFSDKSNSLNKPEKIRIYFQVYSEEELKLCKNVIKAHNKLGDIPIEGLTDIDIEKQSLPEINSLINALEDVKIRASLLKKEGKFELAIEELKTGLKKGLAALSQGYYEQQFVNLMADSYGMLGGNLIRLGRISEALPVYQAGSELEMRIPGITMTYNSVNLFVWKLLDGGWEQLQNHSADIVEVVNRLRMKIKQDTMIDIWSYADLGMCEFLQSGYDESILAYQKAADNTINENKKSMLDQLLKIKNRWPTDNVERNAFYKKIQNILE